MWPLHINSMNICVSTNVVRTFSWHVCNDPWICPLCSAVSSSEPRRTSMMPQFTKLRFTLSPQTNCPLRPSSPYQGKNTIAAADWCLHDVWPNSLTHPLLWQKQGKNSCCSACFALSMWSSVLFRIVSMDVLLRVLFCQACPVSQCSPKHTHSEWFFFFKCAHFLNDS